MCGIYWWSFLANVCVRLIVCVIVMYGADCVEHVWDGHEI